MPDLDEEFIECMEDVLKIYEKPYDEANPVVCVDEKPIQLLAELRPPSGIAPGESQKVDYEYKRNGTTNAFCAVEPLIGDYVNRVTDCRTGDEFAKFIASVERRYELAPRITLIMDSLNTHCEKSLVRFYGEEEGKRIWARFDVHYTPKHGSWLNQAEIAIGMYSRQCLGKARTPDIETLRKKTAAWNKIANRKEIKIKWTFSRVKAREKFDYEK